MLPLATLHAPLVTAWFGLAAVTFLTLLVLPAPYGRHARAGWGPSVPARVGWIAMELPAVVVPILCAALGTPSPGAWVALAAWLLHYLHRTFVYPFRARGRPIPLSVVAMGFGTNVVIDGLVFYDLFFARPVDLSSPLTLVGGVLFLAGLVMNLHSDEVLRGLRAPGESGYRIPRGGAYRWVSCPNYLGEIVEWVGFALLAGGAAWAFAAWTAANLAPRARMHHRWYRATFPDYPPERRALVPFVW